LISPAIIRVCHGGVIRDKRKKILGKINKKVEEDGIRQLRLSRQEIWVKIKERGRAKRSGDQVITLSTYEVGKVADFR
jgi:ribosome recycling factor